MVTPYPLREAYFPSKPAPSPTAASRCFFARRCRLLGLDVFSIATSSKPLTLSFISSYRNNKTLKESGSLSLLLGQLDKVETEDEDSMEGSSDVSTLEIGGRSDTGSIFTLERIRAGGETLLSFSCSKWRYGTLRCRAVCM